MRSETDNAKYNEIDKCLMEAYTSLILMHKNSRRLNVFRVALYGSQNYGLDTETSDIDLAAYIIPSAEDMFYGQKLSREIEAEHGKIAVHDARELTKLPQHMNTAAIEPWLSRWMLASSEKYEKVQSAVYELIAAELWHIRAGAFFSLKKQKTNTPKRQAEFLRRASVAYS